MPTCAPHKGYQEGLGRALSNRTDENAACRICDAGLFRKEDTHDLPAMGSGAPKLSPWCALRNKARIDRSIRAVPP